MAGSACVPGKAEMWHSRAGFGSIAALPETTGGKVRRPADHGGQQSGVIDLACQQAQVFMSQMTRALQQRPKPMCHYRTIDQPTQTTRDPGAGKP